MSRLGRTLKTPFAAGLAGGLVVAALGWAAIAAGWVDVDDEESSAPAPAPQAALSEPVAEGEALTAGEIYERAGPAIAFIEAEREASASPFGLIPPEQGSASGSGFLIDDQGTVLTNHHVVGDAETVSVKLGQEGETLDAEVLGSDPSTDIAVLRVDPSEVDAVPLRLASSEQLQVGDPVVAIGNPFGLDLTVTTGIVSALQREIPAPNGFTISDVIQTDAAINPGNSGGPLLSGAGEVIGINSQIATAGGGGSVGVAFAVPSSTVSKVVEQIRSGGEVEHAFIGISGAPLTPEVSEVLNLEREQGVLVQEVVPDSPAEEAGLRAGDASISVGGAELRVGGDVIVGVDGEQVEAMEDVIAAVNAKQPGDEITLEVVRDGEVETMTLELADRPVPQG